MVAVNQPQYAAQAGAIVKRLDMSRLVKNGRIEGVALDSTTGVSAKAAFAWRSLVPTPYTKAAVEAVRIAAVPGKGWGTGVYEGTGTPTGETNLNTAGLILEALAYRRTGRPFLSESIQ